MGLFVRRKSFGMYLIDPEIIDNEAAKVQVLRQ